MRLPWRKKRDWPTILRSIIRDYVDLQSIIVAGARTRDDVDQALDTFIKDVVKKHKLK